MKIKILSLLFVMMIQINLGYAQEINDIDKFVEDFNAECQHKDYSTVGISNCHEAINKILIEEMNKYYQLVMDSTLEPETKNLLKQSQDAWLKFYEIDTDTIWEIIPLPDGTADQNIASAETLTIVMQRAKEMKLFYQSTLD